MTAHKIKKILIMAGGTGGHVYPGVALAEYGLAHGVEIHWLGTKNGLEAKVIPHLNIPLHIIQVEGIRGKKIKNLLLAPYKIAKAVLASAKLLRAIQPDFVIGMGGFVSGPGAIAALLLRYPLAIHEQNAIPGTTNRVLARFAKHVFAAFPNTFSRKNVHVVGNPIRASLLKLAPPEQRFSAHSALRLLILGGSLGAKAINEALPKAIKNITAPIEIWHQSGEKNFSDAKKCYADENISLENSSTIRLVPFISEMDEALAWADLVICRAGALTVSELCAVGLGAILIPFPYAIDDHQTVNASVMVKNNAAILLPQQDLSERLLELINQFASHRDRCLEMAKNAYALRKTKAVEEILGIISDF